MIADTQFIFGLRENDTYFEKCKSILENDSQRLEIPTIVLLECSMVLKSQEKSNNEIQNFLKTVDEIITLYDISELKMSRLELIKSFQLQSQYPELSFFDSMIVATALNTSQPVLGDDRIFDEISKLQVIKISDYDPNL